MLATPLITRRPSLAPLPVRQRVVPKPLPTMYDLPSELPGDPGLPDDYHIFQPQLLRETFRPPTHAPERVYVATDLNLYYDVEHVNRYKRPDWFAVLGVPRLMRLSYLIWQEQIPPFLAIELLSPGTEKEDLGKTSSKKDRPPTKWEVYEQWLRIPYYVVYSRYTEELQAFQLVDSRYRAIPLTNNRLWFSELQLGLGLWPGEYQNERGRWLRWYDAHDEWITTVAQQRDLEAFRAREYAQLAQLEANVRQLEVEARQQAERRAHQAEQRAQADADARLALEAELARLKSQLKDRS